MGKYLCHKAADPRKVVPKKRRDVLTLDYIAANYQAEVKYDGCQALVHLYTDGRLPLCQSRTGEEYQSFLPAAKELGKAFHSAVHHWQGLVVFCEAWVPGWDFPKISGEYRRHEQSENLQLVVFDVVTFAEYAAGFSLVPFVDRIARLGEARTAAFGKPAPLVQMAESWAPGTYGNPQDLANRLVAAGGHDGAVFKRLDGGWTQGKENGDETLKIKSEVSLDLRVTAIHEEPGVKTGRPVFTISVEYKGMTTKVGSGMPHSRDALPKVGDIVEILSMAVNANGALREPRYKGIRHDKLTPDA